METRSPLKNKKILLCVTGGIAAYKALELTRLLIKAGAIVRPLLTKAAQEFVTPLSFQSLSGNKVLTDLFDLEAEQEIGHIEAARWPDLILVAPATAQTLTKGALGLSDDLLGTVLLASTCQLAFAPSMNPAMFENQSTAEHLELLKAKGALILGPDSGMAACGEEGLGRLLEPVAILTQLETHFTITGNLNGVHCLVTAGPTVEPIDSVRYISNYSSGMMGYALTEALLSQGATVDLISGPTQLEPPSGANFIPVKTAQEMYDAALSHSKAAKIIIASAAVADFRVKQASKQKLKKESMLTLELEQNPDIIKTLGLRKEKGQVLVGFAAETENLIENGKKKLIEKNLDLVVANDVNQSGGVFFQEKNQAVLILKLEEKPLPRMAKTQLAIEILIEIEKLLV
ncbi:MAG: bifunctional phosphopantothenoylcysteine decarboxylase/phosphopantothenate--cysteine ligase CoaBC [SAR324 cluster bacterium]|nr:bifunctional phosphopantothenoylcysteine decarboxylase/phosphopantothenate--cysteine ligase CoaBC [SAR324 cluster bacterium]